ncbi:AraC family transcriptional regulator [Litchfieldia alkalitelluris]|uniref:AraC family transcriptional regulator n=1 Tax=Litchfieldia alkalitelluris TaxID=304268 RepID=UPI000997C736|nr:AraC family transcriptional regulator [Litchfieldia alkalitelluris]
MNYEYEFVRHIESTSLKFFFVSMTHRLYHWHNDIEILMVVDGSVILETGNKKYTLSKNDIFILNSNEVHSLSKTNETNTILAIQFDPKFCKAYFPQLQRIIFTSQYITEKTRKLCWTELSRYMLQIVKEYNKKDKCYQLKLMSTLHLMICSLIENLDYEDTSEKKLSSQQKNIDRLNHIILYVKENYMSKITLKSIAEKENLDMYYLSHFIKKHLSISFQEYLNKVRLEKAVDLLMRTDMNMLDICIESGFSDYRYLNKMFVKEFGCTATEYKKLNENSKSKIPEFQDELQSEVIHNDKALEVFIKHLEQNNLIL